MVLPEWKPRLIASDVDGTLLDDRESISARTRLALGAARAGGAEFILASGRPPRAVIPIAEQLGFAPYSVCANGAVLFDTATARTLAVRDLSTEDLGFLAERVSEFLPGAGLAVERVALGAHDAATPSFVSAPGYDHAWLNPDNVEMSIREVLAEPAIKLLVRRTDLSSDEMFRRLVDAVAGVADITYSSNFGLIELALPGVTKAVGVQQLSDLVGLGAADGAGVLAFGDMPNDKEMLEWAGVGVAMANGHPQVLAAADLVTKSNNDDGVAFIVEQYFPQQR